MRWRVPKILAADAQYGGLDAAYTYTKKANVMKAEKYFLVTAAFGLSLASAVPALAQSAVNEPWALSLIHI